MMSAKKNGGGGLEPSCLFYRDCQHLADPSTTMSKVIDWLNCNPLQNLLPPVSGSEGICTESALRSI